MAQFTTQLTIVGNLTRDPEVRYTQSGQAVASFSVASTPRSFNKDTKEYEDGEPIFTNCTLWGKPAENFAASATKGSRVILTGSFKSRTYQDSEGNDKRATDLIVDEVGMSTTFSSYTKGGAASAPAPAQDGFFPAAGDDTPF
jgi:single-strand DNA-binding protein